VVGFEELTGRRNANFRYAARALNWLGMLRCAVEKAFKRPAQAPSNVEFFKHGSEFTGSWC